MVEWTKVLNEWNDGQVVCRLHFDQTTSRQSKFDIVRIPFSVSVCNKYRVSIYMYIYRFRYARWHYFHEKIDYGFFLVLDGGCYCDIIKYSLVVQLSMRSMLIDKNINQSVP